MAGSGERGAVRVGDRVAQLREGRADRELGRRLGEHVTRVERGRRARRNRQRHEVRVARETGQEAVVGGDEEMAGGAGGEGAPRGPHTGIDHHEVHRPLREAVPHTPQNVLARPEIAGRHLMGDVEQRRAVHARE